MLGVFRRNSSTHPGTSCGRERKNLLCFGWDGYLPFNLKTNHVMSIRKYIYYGTYFGFFKLSITMTQV
jgi:hypothetical protein